MEAVSTTLFNSVMEKVNINISINTNETIYAQWLIHGTHQLFYKYKCNRFTVSLISTWYC